MSIDRLYINGHFGICTDINRCSKFHTNIGPANGRFCPHMDCIVTIVGNIGYYLTAGVTCKAVGCKDTGSKHILRIQFRNYFLIGIMHQSVNINGVTGRNQNAETNNFTTIAFWITLEQRCRNRAVIPAATHIFKCESQILAVLPQGVVQTHRSFRGLAAKIEIGMYSALCHIRHFCHCSINYGILRCPSKNTGLTIRCSDLNRPDTIGSLLVVCGEFNNSCSCHATICRQIDPVLINGFLDLNCILVIKLQGIHPYLRGFRNTGEGKTNTDNFIISICGEIKIIYIQCSLIPSVTYRGQLHRQRIGEQPQITRFFNQINFDLWRAILKLKVSGQGATSHIRKFRHKLRTQHSSRVKHNKGIRNSLVRIECSIQGAHTVLTCKVFILIYGCCALPAGILHHIFPALLQGFIGESIGSINIRICGCRNNIQIIQIKIKLIVFCSAKTSILELNKQCLCAELIVDQFMGCTHSAQGEK